MTEAVSPVKRFDRARIVGMLLAVVGLLDAAYLAYVKLTNQLASCSNIGDCEKVNSSRFADIGGVPIAVLGAVGFALILVAMALDHPGGRWQDTGRYAFFGLTLVGTLYSAYLTYIELFVLRAVCPFCVLSAIVMVALFALSIGRLRALED
ncbi:MAG TPA: vitamin K epoxide reductase family protein [Anaerolineales bacterium]|nr:vitamin K epoxide reductase family protein [Anaerolineales bacterium]